MNVLQTSNARKLREMGYRFNRVDPLGRSFVLVNEVKLLTGKRIVTTVATLNKDGRVEMGDVQG